MKQLIAETNQFSVYENPYNDPYQPQKTIEVYRVSDKDISWVRKQNDNYAILKYFGFQTDEILDTIPKHRLQEYYTFITYNCNSIVVSKTRVLF